MQKTLPEFSVIVPTRNEEEYLPDFFRDLRAQTIAPREVILADAFSTDRTREIAKEYGAHIVDGGLPSVGRNRGAAVATTDVLIFLDADARFQERDVLEKMLQEFVARDFDGATVNIGLLHGSRLARYAYQFFNGYVRVMMALHNVHSAGLCIVAKRAAHEAIGGFDERATYAEDHDYGRRLARRFRFGMIRGVTVMTLPRRHERDGWGTSGIKYILGEIHLVLFGVPHHDLFRYEFGYQKKEDAKNGDG